MALDKIKTLSGIAMWAKILGNERKSITKEWYKIALISSWLPKYNYLKSN